MADERKIALKVAHLFDLLDLVRRGADGDYEFEAASVCIESAFTDRLRNAEKGEVAAYRACLDMIVADFEFACERAEREAAELAELDALYA